jgi:serine/threonine protein kinase
MLHMDLKSFNVVIDEAYNAFIIDLARTGTTYGWNAPETYVDQDQPEPDLKVLQRADIYSFGVVLWEILTRKAVNIPIDMDHGEFFKVEDSFNHQEYIELVRGCLQHEPHNRPELAGIVATLRKLVAKENIN